MTTEAWIALVSVALGGATSMMIVAYHLGRNAARVDAIEKWKDEVSGDVKVMRALLENISGAIQARKMPL